MKNRRAKIRQLYWAVAFKCFNILLFNPIFSFSEYFDKGGDNLNVAYLAMSCSLF